MYELKRSHMDQHHRKRMGIIIYVDELILEMIYEEFIQEDFMGEWKAMAIVMGMHWGHRLGNGNERRDAVLKFDLVDF